MSDDRPSSIWRAGVPAGRVFGVPVIVQPLWFVIVVLFTVWFAPTVEREVDGVSGSASYGVRSCG